MAIDFGNKTLTKCGGKTLPFDTVSTPTPASNSSTLPPLLPGDDTSPRGNWYVANGRLTVLKPSTQVQQANQPTNRPFGVTRGATPTFQQSSYTLTFTKTAGGTYQETINLIANRRDVRTLGELRAAFWDLASTLRGLSVYLQEASAYGALHIDRPQTVTRLLDTDGTTVLEDWSDTSKAKGANQTVQVALYGNPDTWVDPTETLNDPTRITSITGPGTCTVTVEECEVGNLAITRGKLTRTTQAPKWPYDHAIGTIKTAVISGGNTNSDWQITAGFLPRPSANATADQASYTLSVDLVGTRGSATRTVTITMVDNALSIMSVDNIETYGSTLGLDLRGKELLICEHDEEVWSTNAAVTQIRGLNSRNGLSGGSPSANAAQSEADRLTIRYADAVRRPRIMRLEFVGARYVTLKDIRSISYREMGVSANIINLTALPHIAFTASNGTFNAGTNNIVDGHIVYGGSVDRRITVCTGLNGSLGPDSRGNDLDYHHCYNGVSPVSSLGVGQGIYLNRVRIRHAQSNAIFCAFPGTGMLIENFIVEGSVINPDEAGDHRDTLQLGSTSENTYEGFIARKGFITVGDDVLDSDGVSVRDIFRQGPFFNDMTWNSSSNTGDILGRTRNNASSLTNFKPGKTVDIRLENLVVEAHVTTSMDFNEVKGSVVAKWCSCYGGAGILYVQSLTEEAAPNTKHQPDVTWELNFSPQITNPLAGISGSAIVLDNNKAIGVKTASQLFVATPAVNFDSDDFDEVFADLIAFYTPLTSNTDTEVGNGRYRGALFPDGTWNTGLEFNAPPVNLITTSLSASNISVSDQVEVTYILDAAAVDPITITPNQVGLTGTFEDAEVVIDTGETQGSTRFHATAVGEGTIGGDDDSGIAGPNSVALNVIAPGTLVFDVPVRVDLFAETVISIGSNAPVTSDVTITLSPLPFVEFENSTIVIPAGSQSVSTVMRITRKGAYSLAASDDSGFTGPENFVVTAIQPKKLPRGRS